MKVVCFAGYSGSGKTTLVEQVIAQLVARGLSVSAVKHAHHGFDIDQPGKDSWRHRQAGAREVLVASDQRMALMREFAPHDAPDVHGLLARLDWRVDWVVVEGFKASDLPRIEVWRAPGPGQPARPAHYPGDGGIVAVATASAAQLPAPARQPVLDLNAPAVLVEWLLQHAAWFDYSRARHAAPCLED